MLMSCYAKEYLCENIKVTNSYLLFCIFNDSVAAIRRSNFSTAILTGAENYLLGITD